MFASGQTQAVPRAILEEKLGRKLGLGDTFTTKTGTWKVIYLGIDKNNADLLTVERIADAPTAS